MGQSTQAHTASQYIEEPSFKDAILALPRSPARGNLRDGQASTQGRATKRSRIVAAWARLTWQDLSQPNSTTPYLPSRPGHIIRQPLVGTEEVSKALDTDVNDALHLDFVEAASKPPGRGLPQ